MADAGVDVPATRSASVTVCARSSRRDAETLADCERRKMPRLAGVEPSRGLGHGLGVTGRRLSAPTERSLVFVFGPTSGVRLPYVFHKHRKAVMNLHGAEGVVAPEARGSSGGSTADVDEDGAP